MTVAKTVYRSSGQRGFSASLGGDPQRVLAQKFEHAVQVRFATGPCTVQTMEGLVQARPGDAIVTGGGGESWRVSRAHFMEKYRAMPPTVMGEPGAYTSLRYTILALRQNQDFEVWLSDGVSCLRGHAGDWLVDYGDGSLGVVSAGAFAATYEILPSPPAAV